MSSVQELEFTAPVEISCRNIILQSPALVVKSGSPTIEEKQVIIEGAKLDSALSSIVTMNADLILAITDRSGVTYPAIQYLEQRQQFSSDPTLKEKYLRLRRILVHFRSHGKGALAKYRHKIEHERVLRNEQGQAILRQCLNDKILVLHGSFYFLRPENVDRHLGISWLDLRKGRTSTKLEQYLKLVN